VFCIYLRTNSDLCHLHNKLIGFYNREAKCLQRGTDWVFKYSILRSVFKWLGTPPVDTKFVEHNLRYSYRLRNSPVTNIKNIVYIYGDVIPNQIKMLNPRTLPRDFKLIASVCSKLLYVSKLQQQIKHGVCVYI
jgi:hypothetical protein